MMPGDSPQAALLVHPACNITNLLTNYNMSGRGKGGMVRDDALLQFDMIARLFTYYDLRDLV
jgi:hypothetical protein